MDLVDAAPPFRVLLGVMSNPTNSRLRDQIREWNSQFQAHKHGVDTTYVFGSSFYGGVNGSTAAEEGTRAASCGSCTPRGLGCSSARGVNKEV